MNNIEKYPLDKMGFNFIEAPYIPSDRDEYYLRNTQLNSDKKYRPLTETEISHLERNRNSADSWNNIQVTDKFNPDLVKDCFFYGFVRLGDLENFFLSFHDIRFSVGIYNSVIISSDIGSNVSIRNVNLLSHYIIRDEVILQNIDEMVTTNYAKFGNGIVKEGEKEDIRIWIEVSNENGGRKIIPFNRMLPGDAWLWSKFRGRSELLASLKKMTQQIEDTRRGFYGTVGKRSVIKHCRILKDIHIGSDAYIKGANKLKNLTINSNSESPTQIGEGVELVNGIIGYGCRIFYGIKAVRFIMDDFSNLKYGARLINSYLGSNSTISCCEVLNALIFPGHEQHHNSSFLCAATIQGQSNLASGATIGSNHNSRGNDGEIIAGRGFWPGLNVSLKHNCLFSSFNLLAKGSYPSEINNPLPFSLISNTEESLIIFPAYWFGYNMYALARNSWKYKERDKRKDKRQFLEFNYLAPDTVNEMFSARKLLMEWTEKQTIHTKETMTPEEMLLGNTMKFLYADHLENGKRSVKILKPGQAYNLYGDFILFYAVHTIIDYLSNYDKTLKDLDILIPTCNTPRQDWVNAGGQLIPAKEFNQLLQDIESSRLTSWMEVHEFYREQSEKYEEMKLIHALKSLKEIMNLETSHLLPENWEPAFEKALKIQFYIYENTISSREKDFTNPFRNMTFSDMDERDAVMGKLEDNDFILHQKEEYELFKKKIEKILKK